MAFTTGYLGDPSRVGAGERWDPNSAVVLTATDFEDGLVVGRFAKMDSGSLDNMDGSATPVIAGVVLRNVASPVEDGETVDATLFEQWEYQREGFVTVAVKDGETAPAMFGTVYASNAGDADDGLATSTGTDVETTAEFIRVVKPGVWLVNIK